MCYYGIYMERNKSSIKSELCDDIVDRYQREDTGGEIKSHCCLFELQTKLGKLIGIMPTLSKSKPKREPRGRIIIRPQSTPPKIVQELKDEYLQQQEDEEEKRYGGQEGVKKHS